MNEDEIFLDAVRSKSDQAGVFEYDGETGYFYLYDLTLPDNKKIVNTIHVVSQTPDFSEDDLAIKWDKTEERVGLFIKGSLWAIFDHGIGAGGDYSKEGISTLSEENNFNF